MSTSPICQTVGMFFAEIIGLDKKWKRKMPCDYKQYPENWKWLSRQIIADAGNKCELCFAPNGVFIQRIKGAEYPWYRIENTKPEDKFTKVVLTVHHINHDKNDSTKQNLIALCQKCHLRLDLAYHMKNRRAARLNAEKAQKHLTTLTLKECQNDN